MPQRAIIESRPWLLVSLLLAIGYYLFSESYLPGLLLIAWKGAAVGLLAIYSWRRAGSGLDGKLLTALLLVAAIGDMMVEFDIGAGGIAFTISALLGAALYMRNRRERLAFSQWLFALLLVPVATYLAWAMADGADTALGSAGYCFVLASMVALAWTSSFPRYRVGLGAVLILVSTLIFSSPWGFRSAGDLATWLVWPTYYAGQFLIANGVTRTLRRRSHLNNP